MVISIQYLAQKSKYKQKQKRYKNKKLTAD